MRVMVTGAAGFIGYHVAEALLARGAHVIGVDNLSPYYDPALKEARLAQLERPRNTDARFESHRLDLADAAATAALFEATRPARVIHLAAQAGVRYSVDHPLTYADANVKGFLTVLEGCRAVGAEHLVFASSSSVYGANKKQPFAESDGVAHPLSLYGATKRANEVMAHSYAHLYDLPTTGLRFFTVYGPWGRPDMALFAFTKAILEGRPIKVFNHGRMRRDFTYIDDIVEGVLRVADHPPRGDERWRAEQAIPAPEISGVGPFRLYNIGRGAPEALEDFIAAIERATGRSAERELLPMQPGDVEETFCDTAALEAAVGYRPTTTMEEGVARFVAWYRQHYGAEARPTALSLKA
ncbi:MAG: NAD-dependent epimerase/dehydratase family protein [Pseudomonadota bacterium]